MGDEVRAACSGCNTQIDPNDPTLIVAVEVRTDLVTFGGPEPPVDGMPGLFHPECFAAAGSGWRRAD
jgi:hypothetical protein